MNYKHIDCTDEKFGYLTDEKTASRLETSYYLPKIYLHGKLEDLAGIDFAYANSKELQKLIANTKRKQILKVNVRINDTYYKAYLFLHRATISKRVVYKLDCTGKIITKKEAVTTVTGHIVDLEDTKYSKDAFQKYQAMKSYI